MIYLDGVSIQAHQAFLESGIAIYNAEQLAQWIIQSWSGVGSLSLELMKGALHGTILERYMCRLTLAHILNTDIDQAWQEFTAVMEATPPVETDSTCSICFENIGEGVQLKCNHVFHDHCIGKWFMKKTTCPLCRYDIIKGPHVQISE